MAESTLEEVLKGERTSHVIYSDVIEGLKTLPEDCVHCVVTSPPYYGLRDYGTGRWEGGDPKCDHKERVAKDLHRSSTLGPKRDGLTPDNAAFKSRESMYRGKCKKCGARRIDKQIGLEETPEAYITRMVEVFREVRRVLHPTGVCWINIGDSYTAGAGSRNGKGKSGLKRNVKDESSRQRCLEENKMYRAESSKGVSTCVDAGNLLGIPHRLSQAMQADGWILRADVVWVKQSAMPESVSGWRWERCRVKVKPRSIPRGSYKQHYGADDPGRMQTDIDSGKAEWSPCSGCKKCEPNGGLVLRKGSWRPTRAHEHIFLFAKNGRYFCDGEAVRTKIAEVTKVRDTYSRILQDDNEQFAVQHDHETPSNPAGANLRDWWVLKSQQLDEGHYAAFPPSLPAMCIKAGTSQKGVCCKCGMPWCRVIESTAMLADDGKTCLKCGRNHGKPRVGSEHRAAQLDVEQYSCVDRKTLGWRPTCSCNAPAIPALVLDPFTGSGTTGIVANKLGRRFVGTELSEEYVEIARRRLRRRGYGAAPRKDQKKEGGFF